MKKTHLIIAAAVVATGFTACKDTTTEKTEVTSFTTYVDSVEGATPVYTTANWSAIDNEYNDRLNRIDMAKLEAADKERAEKAKERWTALRTNYEIKIKEASVPATPAAPDYKLTLRNRLFGEGRIGTDMNFNWVNGENAETVYKNFVNTVVDNKHNYTNEDWEEIKALYEALDAHKNSIEKDISAGDKLKIAGLKVKFSSTYSIRKPMAKHDEKEAAKQ